MLKRASEIMFFIETKRKMPERNTLNSLSTVIISTSYSFACVLLIVEILCVQEIAGNLYKIIGRQDTDNKKNIKF